MPAIPATLSFRYADSHTLADLALALEYVYDRCLELHGKAHTRYLQLIHENDPVRAVIRMAQMPLDPDHYYRQNLELSGEYIGVTFKATGLIPAATVRACEERIAGLEQMGYYVDESTWAEFWRVRT